MRAAVEFKPLGMSALMLGVVVSREYPGWSINLCVLRWRLMLLLHFGRPWQ